MMTVRCMLRHVCSPGLASTTACIKIIMCASAAGRKGFVVCALGQHQQQVAAYDAGALQAAGHVEPLVGIYNTLHGRKSVYGCVQRSRPPGHAWEHAGMHFKSASQARARVVRHSAIGCTLGMSSLPELSFPKIDLSTVLPLRLLMSRLHTWTAAALMERQPLTLRLLRSRSLSAHAAMEASVSFRQQCSPSAVSPLQFSATATTPMSRTCIIAWHEGNARTRGVHLLCGEDLSPI